MKIERFELRCQCRHPDGTITPYDVVIDTPFKVSGDEWACHLEGSAAKGPPITIRGIDAEQAYALAFQFLNIGLDGSGLSLEDDQGRPITLPCFEEYYSGRY